MSVVLVPAGKQKIENLEPADATTSTENVSLKSTQSGEPETVMTYKKKVIPIDDPIPKDAVIMQEYIPGSDVNKHVFMASGALESIEWYQERLSERFSTVVMACTNSQRARVARETDIAAVKKFRDSEKRTEAIEEKYVIEQKKRKAGIAVLKEEIEEYEEEYETITHAFGKYKKYREGFEKTRQTRQLKRNPFSYIKK
ncbi:hypothetical protein BGZ80_007663 [Entomortierella chlamydospora]|uniref:Uncharacterized protein n=1 Tax=Entomortierella chlamydospora TaxID=101097 RepID=A0A9P6MED0_9FUNG|nr:hypothetical protein BGZ80_007663 [Entomortierella chlamydospora]